MSEPQASGRGGFPSLPATDADPWVTPAPPSPPEGATAADPLAGADGPDAEPADVTVREGPPPARTAESPARTAESPASTAESPVSPPVTATEPPATEPPEPEADRPEDRDDSGPSRRGLLTPGGRWGRWTLRKRIRTGGFAQVWRATDRDGERAAIKFLLRPDSDVEVKRFARERELSLRFHGKWLPRVLDSDVDDFIPWIAFEYLDFPALDQLVTTSGPLSGEALVIFARDLWDAVLSLHEHDVAHRDLSARNVLIDVDDGRLRLIDLGSGTTSDGTLLTQEVFPASSGFAAPEQLDLRAGRVGPKADLWSWAAVVYYAATGTTVFPVEPRLAYYEHLRAGAEPDLAPVPEALRPALAAAFRYEPGSRQAAEVSAALPLRAHEAALRSAEERLAVADAETRALRTAVADAHQRLESSQVLAARIDQLEAQARQAAADAAAARHQLEETAAATRQATATAARMAELRDELVHAVRERDRALESSGARVAALEERLRAADAELARLRTQGNQAARPWGTRSAPPTAAPWSPSPTTAAAGAGRLPAPASLPVTAPIPIPVPPNIPPPSPPRARPAPAPMPPPPPAPAARYRPVARPRPGSRLLRSLGRALVSLAFAVSVVALFLGIASHPSWATARLRAGEVLLVRGIGAAAVTLGALAAALVTALVVRLLGVRPVGQWTKVCFVVVAVVVLAIAYQDPAGMNQLVWSWTAGMRRR